MNNNEQRYFYNEWSKHADNAYIFLTNLLISKNNNNKTVLMKNLDNKALKSIFYSFYSAFYYLITNKYSSPQLKTKLIQEKKVIDTLFTKNIKSVNKNNTNLFRYKGLANIESKKGI